MAGKKKKTKSLLPKRIAGVKVPRALRKGRAGRFISSPVGVALMTEALAVAGAVTAVKKADDDSTVGRLRDDPKEELHRLKAAASTSGEHSAETLRNAFAAASAAFTEALHASGESLESGSKKSPARSDLRAH